MDLTAIAVAHFIRFVLVLFRLSGVFVLTPVLGGQQVPWRIRVLLAVGLSFSIYPVVNATLVNIPTSWPQLLFALAGELAVGLVCGFVVNIVFVAAQMAGALLSRHMGTALAQVLNPLFQTQLPIMGEFFYMFAIVVFVAVNGHHMVIKGMVQTFDRVPLMGVRFSSGMAVAAAGLMSDMFILMIKLAAPTFVALFLVTVALGIIARTVPQINVLIVGFPVKMCLGLVVTAIALGGAAVLLSDSFTWIMEQLDRMLRLMVPQL